MDPEARKQAYLDLVLHRIAKKRFARPQIGTRGGPRKGPSFLKAKSTGLAHEIETAQKFGIEKTCFLNFLKDHSWAHADLADIANEPLVNEVANEPSTCPMDDCPNGPDVPLLETNAVETS